MKKHCENCRKPIKENFAACKLTSNIETEIGVVPTIEAPTAHPISSVAVHSSSKVQFEIVEDSHEISTKRRRCANNDNIRHDSTGHFPNFDRKPSKSRCKNIACNNLTHVYCVRCEVHLCFVKSRNCFWEYHCEPSK